MSTGLQRYLWHVQQWHGAHLRFNDKVPQSSSPLAYPVSRKVIFFCFVHDCMFRRNGYIGDAGKHQVE